MNPQNAIQQLRKLQKEDLVRNCDAFNAAIDILSEKLTPTQVLNITWCQLEPDSFPEGMGKCPKCGGDVYDIQNFCEFCGQMLKWEGGIFVE